MSDQILTRAAWGAKPAKRKTPLTSANVKYCVLHWPGKTQQSDIENLVAISLRGWQAYHINGRGWSDIAYNFAVDLAGRIWELRGWNVDGSVKNMGGKVVSILAVIGAGQTPSDAMKESIVKVQEMADKKFGKKLIRTYHGKLVSTDCPGIPLTKWAKEGFPIERHEAPNPIKWPPNLKKGDSGSRVKRLQKALNALGAKLVADGIFGAKTLDAVKKYQMKYGLKVDGIVGPKTYATLAANGHPQ